MILQHAYCSRRRGVILLVVLSMLTLFAVVGITFVYFSESEATQAANQKQGETIRLPDPDLLFNFVVRQIVFPTDNRSVLHTHSMMENLYGLSGMAPYSGTGRQARFWRDDRVAAGVRDAHLAPPTPFASAHPNPNMIGQDELYRLNKQFQTYNEQISGSVNPTYTYPDHKTPFLGAVAGDWRDRGGNRHGPVAVARSFAREIKLRIAIVDTTVPNTIPLQNNVVGYQEVIVNPFSNSDYAYWLPGAQPNMFIKPIVLPPVAAPFVYAPNAVIQCQPNGSAASIVLDSAAIMSYTLRPRAFQDPNTGVMKNLNFPPPADFGGDVKNLPPEVKTLVGYDSSNNPVFADHDSYWMDLGFPAMQWSNNKKYKMLAAVFIMSNDGKVNLNTAGNLRGRVDNNNGTTFHASGTGLVPGEVNPTKIPLSRAGIPVPPLVQTTVEAEHRQLHAGRALPGGFQAIRGRLGLNVPEMDPSTIVGGYWPLLRNGPQYSGYNIDGTFDGASVVPADAFKTSQAYLLPGQYKTANPIDAPFTNFTRFPFYNTAVDGYNGGSSPEWLRPAAPAIQRSPLFTTPYAPEQVSMSNVYSDNTNSRQRHFALHNSEVFYRGSDSGSDHLNSDLRRLIPTFLSTPEQRWQYSLISNDLNSVGAAPWHAGQRSDSDNDAAYNPYNPTGSPPNDRDPTPGRVSGPNRPFPWNHPVAASTPGTKGEYLTNDPQPPFWRSIFGNTDRLDLARQLPDYPLPTNQDSASPNFGQVDPAWQLNFGNAVTRAQYFVAQRARQRMALEIYRILEALVHPVATTAPTQPNARRYLAQLAANIVDYIDNDDYSTWIVIPDPIPTNPNQTMPPTAANIVWGTELPRLLLNEIYTEAVNGTTSGNRATGPYHLRAWVELYNPLRNAGFTGVWADGANARLNVNNGTPAGSSVYRLLLTTDSNMNGPSTGIRNDPANTLGTPIDVRNLPAPGSPRVNVITFPPANATNPLNVVVAASGNNYGTGTPDSTASPNPGFYVVGHTVPPIDAPANWITNDFTTDQMQLTGVIRQTSGPFPNSPANRPSILLQRLAHPHLPHNPVPTTNPLHVFPGDVSDPNLPYNPYITIDYADHLLPNHAVNFTTTAGTPDKRPVNERFAVGKVQPYAGYSVVTDALNNRIASMWARQYPDITPNGNTTRDEHPDRPQHTFHRHNGVNTVPTPPPTGTFPNPNPGLTAPVAGTPSGLNVNTLRLPFDWLTHLDRAPVSPAELLQISGYRPHELTQQFNQFAAVSNVDVGGSTTAQVILQPNTTVTFTASGGAFLGSASGVPWAIREGDMVYVEYDANPTPVAEWVRVETVSNANYTAFTGQVGQNGQQITIDAGRFATVRCIVPHAHVAPWYLAGVAPQLQSTNRLYRLLEFVAVRNPGVDMGQVRFTSQAARGNIGAMDNVPTSQNYGTRWIQLTGPPVGLSPAQLPLIRPNDALIGMTPGDPLTPAQPPAPVNFNPINVGDTLVVNAGTGNANAPNAPPAGVFPEQRVTVLEVDWQTNRIRVALPLVPAGVGNNPASATLTFDYAYHSGRQPGRIDLNNVWDDASFVALADPQAMHELLYYRAPTGQPADPDRNARDILFPHLVQQRQPMFYSPNGTFSNRLPGSTGLIQLFPNDPTPANRLRVIHADRPFQGMATGDIPTVIPNGITSPILPPPGGYTTTNSGVIEQPLQGIGNTWLSSRHQEGYTLPLEANDAFSPLRTLFELGSPGVDHPYRRFELLSKIWNNATVRSNTFAVWVTVGFFEYDEVNGLGQELNQAIGKNVRHRFFCIIDRTSIDSWLKSQKNFIRPEMVNLSPRPPADGIEDITPANFPALDPRSQTYLDQTVYSPPGGYAAVVGNVVRIDLPVQLPNPFMTPITPPLPATPYFAHHYGRLVQIESDAGSEVAMLLDPRVNAAVGNERKVVPPPYATVIAPNEVPITYPDSHRLFVRLTLAHTGTLIIRPLPVPPTVLYWTQYK